MRRSFTLVAIVVLIGFLSSEAVADSVIKGTKIEEVVKEISDRQKKVDTLQADFRQEKEMALLTSAEVSEGRFVFEKPNRVLWVYDSPKPVRMLIADGWLTTYYPDLGRAEELEVRRFEDRIFRYLGAASGAIEELTKYFDFRFIDRKGSPYILELDPKTKSVARRVRKLTIWIDRESFITTSFEYIEGDGDMTRYEFVNIRINDPIPPDTFVIDLPTDVRVERMKLNR